METRRFEPLSFRGRVELSTVESALLKGNRAGDPHVRELPVYVPPGADSGARHPVVFLLIGFTGNGREFLETHRWRPGVVAQFDRALARGEVPPAILVMPDCFTRYGGSQYVNSSFNGPYEDHLVQELAPWVDSHYPTLAGRRGVVGKSSGGIGALHLGMRHPEVFRAVGSISGDCGFEACHAPGFWECLRALVPFDHEPARYLEQFLEKPELSGDAHGAINTFAMAACYSPNPSSPLGFDLPFDPRTGERIESVWRRWLEFDPLVACERYVENLKRLEILHIECGLKDEFNIQWGTRRLAQRLREIGVAHTHEEHAGGHRGLQERYLPVLGKVIARLNLPASAIGRQS
jgi:S-formylglutathione hydrolase FrmB